MSAFSRAVSVAFTVAWASAPLLHAQQTGEIQGTIGDETHAALAGVRVSASGPSLQGERRAVSDGEGFFRLPLLPVGTYDLTFASEGFSPLKLWGREVRLGHTATLSVTLNVKGVEAEITVSGESPLIDATSGDTSFRLTADDLRRVPSEDRTIAELTAWVPGVAGVRANTITGSDEGAPSFRGEGDAGNNWLVDGASTRGSNYNDPAVRVNYDAWEEVQVVSDGFAPELGHALGGSVNVVTKSGGNAFHGEAGGLLRPQAFRAERQEQLSAASLPATSIQNYYANLGGPIVRDKLWFFGSDNVFSTLDVTSDQTVGWLEIPPGERRVTTNNLFGKLTFSPAPNHTVSATGAFDDSLSQSGGIGVPETYTESTYDHRLYRLNYRGILSSSAFLTAAVGHYRRTSDVEPVSGDYGPPSYFWQDIAQTTNNVGGVSTSFDARTDVAVAASWQLARSRAGRHELRAGLSHYWNSTRGTNRWTGRDADPWRGDGFDDGAGFTWAGPGTPITMMEYRTGGGEQWTRGFGLYVQDTATLGRISLMAGLRTDTQAVFNDQGRELWTWGLGDFLQPRVALTVDLGEQKTFLKLAYGRFAMPVATAFLVSYNQACAWCFRQYAWTGPAGPTDAELRDPANWEFLWEQSAASMPMAVDPAIRPNRVDRFLVALERQLAEGWVLKLRGIRSQGKALLEDYGYYDAARDPNVFYEFKNLDLKRRHYWAAEAELNARVGGRLQLDASYTWSSAKGTVPGNAFESGTWSQMWGGTYESGPFGDRPYVPEGDPNRELYDSLFGGLGGPGLGDEGWYGYLPYGVDHDVKVLARCAGPWGVRLSASLEWLSGYHWEKKGFVAGYGGYLAFPEWRGSRTTPAHAYLDLGATKELRLGEKLRLDVGVSASNLFDSQTPVSYAKEDNDLFGQVWGRQLPRWVQLRLGLRF